MKEPRRKVVVFLVEGQSEINVLNPILSALYDSIDEGLKVFFPMIVENNIDQRGDLTSKQGITPKVIEGCINKLFLKNLYDKEKIYPKDITEIIQIVDLDGAYIDDAAIELGENPNGVKKPYYSSDKIITNNVENIKDRNKRKRENIDYLCSLNELHISSKKPKYSIFFFSSNLDHFLYNNANIIEGREKVKRADDYAMQYITCPDKFVKAIKEAPGVLTGMTYEESWSYIRENGNNSLERHTNINILFDRLLESIDLKEKV